MFEHLDKDSPLAPRSIGALRSSQGIEDRRVDVVSPRESCPAVQGIYPFAPAPDASIYFIFYRYLPLGKLLVVITGCVGVRFIPPLTTV